MTQLQFGALAPRLREQLKAGQFKTDDVRHWQKDADAITRLAVRGLITPGTKAAALKRLVQRIERAS